MMELDINLNYDLGWMVLVQLCLEEFFLEVGMSVLFLAFAISGKTLRLYEL